MTESHQRGADAFGLSSDDVAYSLDKDRRWEMESDAARRLAEEVEFFFRNSF